MIKIEEDKLKAKTFSIEEKQLKELKGLSKKTGIPEAKLIRIAIEHLLNDKGRLKARFWTS
jgi:predicted DNA-binding protein